MLSTDEIQVAISKAATRSLGFSESIGLGLIEQESRKIPEARGVWQRNIKVDRAQ